MNADDSALVEGYAQVDADNNQAMQLATKGYS